MRLDTLESEIEFILSEHEKTRGDDMALYLVYLCNHDVGILKVFSDKSYRVSHGISSFESVSRCRRKLQEKYPELKPPTQVVRTRAKREKEFREYVRGEKC